MIKPDRSIPLDKLRKQHAKSSCWSCKHCEKENGLYICNRPGISITKKKKLNYLPRLDSVLSSRYYYNEVDHGLGINNMSTKKCATLGLAGSYGSFYAQAEFMSLSYHVELNSHLNDYKDGDFFEVYVHPETLKKVNFCWWTLSQEEVEIKQYYVCKNKKYFYCESFYDGAKGFIPLEDPISLKELKIFTNISEAIEFVDTCNARANRDDNVVYSTRDELEERFQKLERRTKRNAASKR